jgi:hypothetical protein
LSHNGALVEKYLLLQEWRIVDKSNVENNKLIPKYSAILLYFKGTQA